MKDSRPPFLRIAPICLLEETVKLRDYYYTNGLASLEKKSLLLFVRFYRMMSTSVTMM
jgi:hypothetical protein